MSHAESRSDPPLYSEAIIRIIKRLSRHGGCMRIAALAREVPLPCEELCAVLNGLAERRWIKIAWRRTPHAALPPRLREVSRVTLTRLGRARLPVPWTWHPPRLSRRRRHPGNRQAD